MYRVKFELANGTWDTMSFVSSQVAQECVAYFDSVGIRALLVINS